MYNDFFGFREPPFNVTPDPRFFYPNPMYEEAFANLRYGIRARKGFILVTGEVGTGKTLLLRRLIDSFEPTTAFVFLFNTRLSFDEVLSFACDELNIRPAGTERVRKIQALNDFLLERLRKGGTTALLVDEAQDLSDDVLEDLRLLSNLETTGDKLLQIVLVGQPELETKLAQPALRQLRQRIALRTRLDRLRAREVGKFVEHRLAAAGYEGGDLFTPQALVAVAEYSRGVPRIVNQLCDNALLIAFASSRRQVTPEIVDEVAEDLRLKEEIPESPLAALALDQALRQVEEQASRMTAPAAAAAAAAGSAARREMPWAAMVLILLLAAGGGFVTALRSGAGLEDVARSASALLPAAAMSGPASPAAPKPAEAAIVPAVMPAVEIPAEPKPDVPAAPVVAPKQPSRAPAVSRRKPPPPRVSRPRPVRAVQRFRREARPRNAPVVVATSETAPAPKRPRPRYGARMPVAIDPFGEAGGQLSTLDPTGFDPARHCVTRPAGYPATIP